MTTNTQDSENNKGMFRKIFNYLSTPPKRSFTLGGFIFGEADKSQFEFNQLKAWSMPRLMRGAERAVTLTGVFASVAYAATIAAPVVAIPVALGLIVASKVAGVTAAMAGRVALNAVEKRMR